MSTTVLALLCYLAFGLALAAGSFVTYRKEARKHSVLDTIVGMFAITLAWPALIYFSVKIK